MPPRSYATPEGFRQALEQRVRAAAGASGMSRFRQVLVFDRFLARVFQQFGDRAIANVYDRHRVLAVVAAARPDVVVHLLTDLAERDFDANDDRVGAGTLFS
jgi:hypothetical protein